MVKIRLARYGRKNRPSFRIVAIDSRKQREGKYLEKLGYYNPSEDAKKVVVNKERYEYWISVGAQPTESVVKLIKGKYEFKPYDPNVKKDEEGESSEEANTTSAEEQEGAKEEKSTEE